MPLQTKTDYFDFSTQPAKKIAACVSARTAHDCGHGPIMLLSTRADSNEPMKVAQILDQAGGTFGLEYDNTLGKKNTMRLDAINYDSALREAKSFLGIKVDDHDADGTEWHIE